MKKLLIFALCLLGICNAHAEMMTAQEIILTEIATMQPWDSEERDEKVDANLSDSEDKMLIKTYAGVAYYSSAMWVVEE